MGLLEETTAPISISTLFLLVKTSRRLDLGMYNSIMAWEMTKNIGPNITSFIRRTIFISTYCKMIKLLLPKRNT